MLPSDTVRSVALLRDAARQAAQRADEAGDDLSTVYASIEAAYAALDALYSHPGDVSAEPDFSTHSEISLCTCADQSGELETSLQNEAR